MANRVINTILNLRDNMSGGLIRVARNTEGVTREMESATRSVVAFKNRAVSALGSATKSFVKWGAASAGAVTAAFLAMDSATEDYRIAQGKLNTAYEAAGYSAETAATAYNEFYQILGDTDTATEASQLLSKLVQNEQDVTKWTRVAAGVSGTFGDSLPIEGLIEATNETAKVGKVTGVLADALNWVGISEDKMNERLERTSSEAERNRILLETLTGSYDDAADAFYRNNEQLVQARKNQAALSAMTAKLGNASAIAKNSLMRLFGVQEDGSIRAGSALAWLNDRAESVLAKFQEWSQDGTMDALAQKLDQGLARAGEMAGNAFQWVLDHGDTIKRWVVGLGTALALVKVAQFASGVMNAIKTVKLFATTVGTIVAANPVVLAIVAAIAAISLLVANWDKVKAKAGELWDGIKTVFGGIKDSIVGAFNSAKEAVGSFFSWIGDKLSALDGAIESVPVIGSIYRGIKGAGSWVIDKVTGHATGTSYFPGGWTRVNERGGEIMRLPGGTQIIPHDVSRRMVGGTTVQVYVTVQGNVIGNQAYAESLGETIAQKLLRALRNS
ncbi:MAG: hypothetical protein Q3Y02_00660 [Dysosmobacter sp.]|jgi:hypothetical protein|nr:hypothetical protein [Dysosmobacter sp.]DAX71115.1 MAG TPA: minor tail protein [Caudoviricetes sp.]